MSTADPIVTEIIRNGFIAATEEGHHTADLEHGLHGAFAKGAGVTDHDCATVVLQCGRENLAGTGA